jgi:hypothetical protein
MLVQRGIFSVAGTAAVRLHCNLAKALRGAPITEDTKLKIKLIIATTMFLLSGSMVLAQNAGTGTTTSPGIPRSRRRGAIPLVPLQAVMSVRAQAPALIVAH